MSEATQASAVTGGRGGRVGSPRLRALGLYAGSSVLTLLVISAVAFAATSRSGSEVARNVLGRGATTRQLDAYARARGLDRPLVVRYLDWLWNCVHGNWGTTLSSGVPVSQQVIPGFIHTAELAVISLAWSLPIALLLGLFMARRRGLADLSMLAGLVVLAALPEFVVGISVLMVFAVWLGWLPVDSGALQFGSGISALMAFVLPALTLGLGIIPYVSRITRASVSESLAAPYTRGAVLRGLPRRRVIWRHTMRSASVPLVNAVAINIVYLMGGVIVVENVFAFPGIGRQLVQAITQGDTNTVLAIIMLLGTLFIALGFVADLVVVYLNPRLRAIQ